MIIEPVIQGVVARSAHPYGCQQAVRKQIDYVKQASPIVGGAKRVLVLGASSGFGLASRIAHTFGGAQADTIGVSFERGPSEKGVGSAVGITTFSSNKKRSKQAVLRPILWGTPFHNRYGSR